METHKTDGKETGVEPRFNADNSVLEKQETIQSSKIIINKLIKSALSGTF